MSGAGNRLIPVATEQEVEESRNRLLGTIIQTREFNKDLLERVEKFYEYSVEELEIQIESLKIKLDDAEERMGRRLCVYERRLRTMNSELSIGLDESSLFNEVSVRSLEKKCNHLNKHVKVLNNKLSMKYFRKCRNSVGTGQVGLVVGYRQLKKYEQAKDQLLNELRANVLLKNDVAEIRTYVKPPYDVEVVIKATCVAFKMKPSWKNFQSLSRNQIIEKQLNIDVNEFSYAQFKKLKEIVEGNDFKYYQRLLRVGPKEMAVSRLRSWVNAFYKTQELRFE